MSESYMDWGEIEAYTREDFPLGWDESDIKFLADFLSENSDIRLYRKISGEQFDYVLLEKKAVYGG